MKVVGKLGAILGLWIGLGAMPAWAIPGQTTSEVLAWMKSNSTLRPNPGEKLLIRRNSTAAMGFSFEASLLPPGRLSRLSRVSLGNPIIRSETLTLFDMRNGVTLERLRESLRTIYGVDVAQDFERSQTLHTYPSAAKLQASNSQAPTPQASVLQGELREGNRFGYWLEIAPTEKGYAYSGRLMVFLRDDVAKLKTELQNQ